MTGSKDRKSIQAPGRLRPKKRGSAGPGEPAARKQQLPSDGKEKLHGRAPDREEPAPVSAKPVARAAQGPAAGGDCGVRRANPGSGRRGSGGALSLREEWAPSPGPHPSQHRKLWAERRGGGSRTMPGRAGNLGALRGPAASPPEAACRHLQPGRVSDDAAAPAATAPPPASSPGGSRAAVNPRRANGAGAPSGAGSALRAAGRAGRAERAWR